jgi:hypothetical protein
VVPAAKVEGTALLRVILLLEPLQEKDDLSPLFVVM